jgi:hypothetical protein
MASDKLWSTEDMRRFAAQERREVIQRCLEIIRKREARFEYDQACAAARLIAKDITNELANPDVSAEHGDCEILNWMEEQVVDVVYFDDGRIIDATEVK